MPYRMVRLSEVLESVFLYHMWVTNSPSPQPAMTAVLYLERKCNVLFIWYFARRQALTHH
jgi:hypothetical protein